MFIHRCVVPLVAALSVVACDRSDESPPPRRVVADAPTDIAAPTDTTSGGEEQVDYVDDYYLVPPYDSYEASDDDFPWEDGDVDEEYEEFFGQPDPDTDGPWCDDDERVCEYYEQ